MTGFGPVVGTGLAVAAVGCEHCIPENTLHDLGHLDIRSLDREEHAGQRIQHKKDVIVSSREGHTTSRGCCRATGWLGVIGQHIDELSDHKK